MPLFIPTEKLNIPTKSLRDRYIIPPFSILDSQKGDWLKRRNEWENIIQNRDNNIRNVSMVRHNTPYLNALDYDEGYKGLERNGASSTFDPFLCEILIKWFSRESGIIYDPFAGGHVRGVVASILNRNYIGIDINPEQVQANIDNWNSISDKYDTTTLKVPKWVCGDSANTHIDTKADMLLACPPYYNLEVYTNDPNDLSTASTYATFIEKYREIIVNAYDMLNQDSFAVIVVEEIRDKQGIFYGFVPDTIKAFTDAGFLFYNEMILANRIMSLGVRCPKYFDQSRKVGRHHQNVLVFFKGDPKHIHDKFGNFEKD